MYTHKKFFIAAGLSGLWYGVLELVGYLGWYWLIVVLLAVPCVLCFSLWMRLEGERELRQSIEDRPDSWDVQRKPVTSVCGSCIDYQKCFRLGLCTYSGTCEFWYPSEDK